MPVAWASASFLRILDIFGIFIHFDNERPGISALFTPVYLSDITADYLIDLAAPADRTSNHLQQVYVAHKEMFGVDEDDRHLAWRVRPLSQP